VPVSSNSGLILKFTGGSSLLNERRAASATAYGTASPGSAFNVEPGLLFANVPAHPPGQAPAGCFATALTSAAFVASADVLSRGSSEIHS